MSGHDDMYACSYFTFLLFHKSLKGLVSCKFKNMYTFINSLVHLVSLHFPTFVQGLDFTNIVQLCSLAKDTGEC